MKYLKVKWIHPFPSEPIVLMSELDDERYEIRKVEFEEYWQLATHQGG
jgi:hypothetical protein